MNFKETIKGITVGLLFAVVVHVLIHWACVAAGVGMSAVVLLIIFDVCVWFTVSFSLLFDTTE